MASDLLPDPLTSGLDRFLDSGRRSDHARAMEEEVWKDLM